MKKEVKITNSEKILFKNQKISKMDVANYYTNISEFMLPYVKERLLSVVRCHEGLESCFFKKHPNNDKNIHTKKVNGEDYFYINDIFELVYQVQLGTIEFHTWGSSVELNSPDVMIFDLDPDKNLELSKLRDSVLKIKSVLEELNLKSFLKTSGGKGYHIVLPFKNTKNWDSFYEFSRQIAVIAESKWPKIFTTNIRKSERTGKIFVDYLRNSQGSTCVAPYSLRAKEYATISMPIKWEDLEKVKPFDVNIKNYQNFLNDAWKDFFKVSQSIK